MALPSGPTLHTPGHNRAINNEYLIDTKHVHDEGLLQVPVASDNRATFSKIVRTHAPTGQKIVKITAERNGEWPVMPDPETALHEILLHSEIITADPCLIPGAQGLLYRATAIYTYALRQAKVPPANYFAGKSPAYKVTGVQAKLPMEKFAKGIINDKEQPIIK